MFRKLGKDVNFSARDLASQRLKTGSAALIMMGTRESHLKNLSLGKPTKKIAYKEETVSLIPCITHPT